MVQRIDGVTGGKTLQTNNNNTQPTATPRETVRQPSGVEDAAVRWRMEANNQLAEARKRELLAMVAGGVTGASAGRDTHIHKALKDALGAYRQELRAGIEAIRNNRPDAPRGLPEATARALRAHDAVLQSRGVRPADAYGQSLIKKIEFLNNQAAIPGAMTRLDANAIIERARTNAPAGDVFTRVLNGGFLTDPEKSFLTRPQNPVAWVSTPEEIAGFKLNQNALLTESGFTPDYLAKANPGDYVLFVGRRQDFEMMVSAKWDNLFGAANTHKDFKRFSMNAPEFRAQIIEMNDAKVKTPSGAAITKYQSHLEGMGKLLPDEYAATLPPQEGEAFLARHLLETEIGANPQYTGKGYTADANGNIGFREFLVRNQKIADAAEFAMLPLRAGDYNSQDVVATNRAPQPYNPAFVTRGDVGRGALMGGGLGAVTTLAATFNDVRSGRTTWNEAARTLPGQLANQTALGASIGFAETAIEGAATRGIALGAGQAQNALSSFAANGNGALRSLASRGGAFAGTLAGEGTTMFGALGRRALGGGIAGGFVNGGIASFEQIQLLRHGRVSGSQAIGTITGEVAVGFGAGVAGMAAGAAIGSVIPIAGTAVGAVIGFGVGMAAGYVADKGLRGLGVNKAIAGGVTNTIEAGQRLAGDVQRFGANAMREANQVVNNGVAQVKRGAEALQHGARQVNGQVAAGVRAVKQEAVRQYVAARQQVNRAVTHGARAGREFVAQTRHQVGQIRRQVGATLTQAQARVSHSTRAAAEYVSQIRQQAGQVVSRTVGEVRQTVNRVTQNVQHAASNMVGGAVNNLRAAFGWN